MPEPPAIACKRSTDVAVDPVRRMTLNERVVPDAPNSQPALAL
ncbi:hypothetical protein [Roseiconus nitratireducens]|nr:hypothetical protein [Roseiconus nitratireducens]